MRRILFVPEPGLPRETGFSPDIAAFRNIQRLIPSSMMM